MSDSPWAGGSKAAKALTPDDVSAMVGTAMLAAMKAHGDHLSTEGRFEVTLQVTVAMMTIIMKLMPRGHRVDIAKKITKLALAKIKEDEQ